MATNAVATGFDPGVPMKVGIVGAGAVGAATGLALVQREVCRQIVLIDRDPALAAGVALDLRCASALSRAVDIRAGGYRDLAGAALVILTVGVNERAGGVTDRADPRGRLRLAGANVRIFADVVPAVVDAAPQAVLMVVTDPPELLAEIARSLAGHSRVFSTGTLLDSLRFRVHLALRLGVQPADVSAMVIGEHGTSEVFCGRGPRWVDDPFSICSTTKAQGFMRFAVQSRTTCDTQISRSSRVPASAATGSPR
jgi:L-lactate dehydrogenase